MKHVRPFVCFWSLPILSIGLYWFILHIGGPAVSPTDTFPHLPANRFLYLTLPISAFVILSVLFMGLCIFYALSSRLALKINGYLGICSIAVLLRIFLLKQL